MKDRIILLIKARNLTAAQFAEKIGVQKSSISHIISGRNNASLDFIQKVLVSFPEVNMEWLMFGKGPLYKDGDLGLNPNNDGALTTIQPSIQPSMDLFSELTPGEPIDFRKENSLSQSPKSEDNPKPMGTEIVTPFPQNENRVNVPTHKTENQEQTQENSGNKKQATKVILKIVEFYSDNTYREFYPE